MDGSVATFLQSPRGRLAEFAPPCIFGLWSIRVAREGVFSWPWVGICAFALVSRRGGVFAERGPRSITSRCGDG